MTQQNQSFNDIITLSESIVHAHSDMIEACREVTLLANKHNCENTTLRKVCTQIYVDLSGRKRDGQLEHWHRKLHRLLMPNDDEQNE